MFGVYPRGVFWERQALGLGLGDGVKVRMLRAFDLRVPISKLRLKIGRPIARQSNKAPEARRHQNAGHDAKKPNTFHALVV